MAFNNSYSPYGYYPQTTALPQNQYNTNMYNNGQMQNQSPYYQQQPYQNQIQQFNTVKQVHGRVVDTLEEIMPNEVYLDGSISAFPSSDFSCVYVKAWTGDGTIKTLKFVPEQNNNLEIGKDNNDITKYFGVLDEKINSLTSRFDNIENLIQQQTQQQNTSSKNKQNTQRKEVVSNE